MRSPYAVFEEVKFNFIQHYDIKEFDPVRKAFDAFINLFDGKYPGYRACNTKYHDKLHTTDALLAMSRLIDGYNIVNKKFPVGEVVIAIIATLFHDAGYIQKKTDTKGTGAKYTLNHVQRSIDFIERYFKKNKFPQRDFKKASNMINCTGLIVDLQVLDFKTKTEHILGLMLGSADLLGQMASRTYLERLIYLYKEFREGHVFGYDSEYNLFKKTLGFHDKTEIRLQKTLGNVRRYVVYHFKNRYGTGRDLYALSIEKQIKYLKKILRFNPRNYKNKLRRKD
jgi:hypothetical protein